MCHAWTVGSHRSKSHSDPEVTSTMKLFKSYTLTWQQMGIFKLALFCAGIAVGTYWHKYFRKDLVWLVVSAVVASVYISYVTLRQ